MVVIKIFDATDTNFNTAGNIIIKPLFCKETKKKSLNGWYIDVEIPIKYKQYIEQDKLCVVQTKSKLNPQAFRVKDIEYTLDKIVFKAHHVMFDAEDYFLLDVRPTNMNGLNALNYINDRTDKISPFSMLSNVENVDTAYFIRKSLLQAWAIIEERWQGVFDADNWNISFLSSVGSDKGETIRYGKNLQGMNITEDWSGVCTKLYPVGQDELMLPENFLESEIQYDEPYTRTIKFDTKLDEEQQTTANLLAELRTNATNYLNENSVPKVCYEINSNINQDMEIGDIIAVKHPLCDISTEVLEYEYDLLTKKVVKLVFGNYTKNVKKKFQAITESIEAIREAVSKQEVVINNQTNIINSLNKNGYVYIDDNEILILDALPKENAQNVWRFGLGGIAFSSNGYEGPFEVAMTMDGQINANFITTGTLSVARIEGLANFISETNSQLSTLEVEQGNITARVSSTESSITNLQSQIDGAIQFWNGANIPTLSNYPASDWTTEAQRNNHRADIYTVIQDVQGELKQGKSYRFDKVNNTWQWIELTDNELSAVQALANSKAKVFYATPTVPYNLGDLWLRNGKLYKCKTAKDTNGSYSASDWEEAVEYTDDTVALLAQSAADAAQSTADDALAGINNIVDTDGSAEGKYSYLDDSAEDTIISAKLDGETSQATRSGKNLLNKNATAKEPTATKVVLSTGVRAVSSVDGTNKYFGIEIGKSELLGQTVTISATITPSSSNAGYISMFFGNSSTAAVSSAAGGLSETGSVTKTIPSSFPENCDRVYALFYGNRGGTGVAGDYVNYTNLQIEKGSTATSYEEYGVSPSPDYPSEIENLEGKNLFDETQLLEAEGWSKNSEGYYTGTSSNLYAKFKPDAGGFSFAKAFKENTRYIISWIAYASSGTGNARFRIYYTDNTYQECGNWNYTTPKKMYAVSSANKTIDKITYIYGNNPGTIYIKDIQLEERNNTKSL